MDYRISTHAEEELIIRDIPRKLLDAVLTAPDQIVPSTATADVYQSKFTIDGREWLIRAVVAHDVDPKLVITVYKTSKTDKYWRTDDRNL